MQAARELAQLVEREAELVTGAPSRMVRAPAGSESSFASAIRSDSASETSRCCAPSWRLRSRRRRSTSPAVTIRARDAASSSSRR